MSNNLPNLSLSDIIAQFIDAMANQGIETKEEILADGKLHRFHVDGDSKGSKNGFYCLHFDAKPAGIFGCNKRYGFDHRFSWQANMKGVVWTDEERKAYKIKIAKERAEKEAIKKKREDDAASRANHIWDNAAPATNDHPYLISKGVKAHGLRQGAWERVDKETGDIWSSIPNSLLVPLCDRTKKIHSLQAIFPSKQESLGGRNKDYMADGAKRGLFHAIGRPLLNDSGLPVFVLCEGYATGATIYEVTNHMTMVCFDTGNLAVVAKAIHDGFSEKGKKCVILIAADNDRWTKQPIENPGVYHANAAARAVGGLVAIPDFIDLSGEPTDFNDLHAREGAEAVVRFIDAALLPPAVVVEEEEVPTYDPAYDPLGAMEGDEGWQPDEQAEHSYAQVADDEIEDQLIDNGHFAILGYDGDDYYFFHHGKEQILVRTSRSFSHIGLIELAPINWWEEHFPSKDGMDAKAACNWIFRTADSRGIYDMDRIRGRGAWIDKGRSVFHHGNKLTVDGEEVGLSRIKSAYVYPMAQRMPELASLMMDQDEGAHLLQVAKMIRWSKPASAALFAGWTMLAPICGALKWRPHIWVTGAAGSGKSTVQRDFCGALTRGISIYAQGESTEAGIRQRIRGDARPVLMDEAESNDDKSKNRMDAILATIRQASTESEAETLKGTVHGSSMRFCIRSMFCLASINTNLGNKADIDRLTRLTVRPPARDGSGEAHWKKLSEELYKISNDDQISSRLLARALTLLPSILINVSVFSKVASRHFNSQRDGDQFGALLAGAWSLSNDAVATEQDAQEMIDQYEWSEHIEDHDQDDAERALGEVLDAKIRVGSMGELSVYELIREASPSHNAGVMQTTDADSTLKRHGIRVEHEAGVLLFGTSVKPLLDLVARSSYATDLRSQLLRIQGATRHENRPVRFNGRNSKAVSIPLSPILESEQANYHEVPI